MQLDVVRRILEGNYTVPTEGLDFSCSKVEVNVSCDHDYEGSFHIYAIAGTETGGYVYTSDSRMECINCTVSGSDTEISYHFHGDLCRPGDCIRGNFGIVTNHGEYLLPFVVNVLPAVPESSIGPIKNLFSFTNLVKTNYKEALDLFYSPDFVKVLDDSESTYLDTYRALSTHKGKERNLEEFLICTGKKQRIEYIIRKREMVVSLTGRELSNDLVEKEVEIVRNGWGYTNVNVRVEGGFFFAEKQVLTDADFLGNVCQLKIFIVSKHCKNGIHSGKLILENAFGYTDMNLEIRSIGIDSAGRKIDRSRGRIVGDVMRYLYMHDLGSCSDEDWIRFTGKYAEQLLALDESDIAARFFLARILIAEGRMNEASWIVDQIGDTIEKMEKEKSHNENEILPLIAFHWYMAALVKNEENFWETAASRVENFYRKQKNNWMMGVLCLHMPTSFNANVSSRWSLLEYLYEQGTHSPIVYSEGVRILNENSSIAREAEGFTLQVMNFGAKHLTLNSSAVEQIIFLSGRMKGYSPLFCRVLCNLYTTTRDKRILQEICAQLIKGQRKDQGAFSWYSQGVKADLRLTNLYEYYVMSIDRTALIDVTRNVLQYFTTQPGTDYEKMAYLYRYIIRTKAENQDIYENNLKLMQDFAISQVKQYHINGDLAVVYDEMLRPELVDKEQAVALSELMFAQWVICANKRCNKAYVYQKGYSRPLVYELKNGEGIVVIYGSGYTLAFEDAEGNVYIDSTAYSLENMMSSGKYMSVVANYVKDNTRFNMYMLGNEQDSTIHVTAENIHRFAQLADSRDVTEAVRTRMLLKCMDYFLHQEDDRMIVKCLNIMDMDNLSAENRSIVFEYLMRLERYDTILDWIRKYGPYFTSEDNIKNFLERMITPRLDGRELKAEEAIVTAAYYVFKAGKGSSIIAQFLEKNYSGMSRDMRDIWKALVTYSLPRRDLVERLLVQLLYSGAYLPERYEIASEYLQTYPESRLARAVMAQECFDYFTGSGKADDVLMGTIGKYASPKAKLPGVLQLAYLKYYAENIDKLDEASGAHVLNFLRAQVEDRVYLNFFMNFIKSGAFENEQQQKEAQDILEILKDRVVIDYKVRPGKLARIHYMMTHEDGEAGEYSSEYMRNICGGVCFKDFVLFFGENLQYYITEEEGEKAALSESGTLQKNDVGVHRGVTSKYELINDLVVCRTLQDYVRFDNLLEEYYKREYFNSELFRIM